MCGGGGKLSRAKITLSSFVYPPLSSSQSAMHVQDTAYRFGDDHRLSLS